MSAARDRAPSPALHAALDRSRDEAAAHARAGRLWLALDLPALALEARPGRTAGSSPRAVADGARARAPLVAVDAAAAAAGVRPGMAASAAGALCPGIEVTARDPVLEREALEGLAARTRRLTPVASLAGPSRLLLEIGGSLALLGGLGPLLAEVRADLAALGYTARIGIAPTPLAAELLARAGLEDPVTVPEALPGRLAAVPVACLDLPPRALAALAAIGVRRLAECRRLSRADLSRRIGPELIERLDRALGRRADPRPAWRPPPTFERRLALAAPSAESPPLLAAARRGLLELEGLLAARAEGVQAIEVHLRHRRPPATRLAIELAAPARDARRLLDLLAVRLERLALRDPVEEVGLRARAFVALAPESAGLWRDGSGPGGDEGDGGWRALVDRLHARLGRGAVAGLAPVAEHRPERAWRRVAPGAREGAPAGPFPPRPGWLLDPPRPLGRAPVHDGRALRLVRGPERIESGWWDGAGIARDYYVAETAHGRRLWIYRERRGARRWYLHGLFA